MSRRASRWRTWRSPVAIGIVSLGGLVAALVGDGAWDAASWLALGLPLAVCIRAGLRHR